jgi:hypothetical protein
MVERAIDGAPDGATVVVVEVKEGAGESARG